MKKFILIIVLCLVWIGSAYANNIILNCKYLNGINYYDDGKTGYADREGMIKRGIEWDRKYLINANKKELFEESTYDKEFFLINNSTKAETNSQIEWNDMNITWRITYKYKDYEGYDESVLDRSTGALKIIKSYDESNLVRKSTNLKRLESNYNCEVVEKKF